VKEYMKFENIDVTKFVPGATEKKPSVAKLTDLKAKPVKAVKVKKQEAVVGELEVTEVTE
jgi:hypothetical protein